MHLLKATCVLLAVVTVASAQLSCVCRPRGGCGATYSPQLSRPLACYLRSGRIGTLCCRNSAVLPSLARPTQTTTTTGAQFFLNQREEFSTGTVPATSAGPTAASAAPVSTQAAVPRRSMSSDDLLSINQGGALSSRFGARLQQQAARQAAALDSLG